MHQGFPQERGLLPSLPRLHLGAETAVLEEGNHCKDIFEVRGGGGGERETDRQRQRGGEGETDRDRERQTERQRWSGINQWSERRTRD